MTRAGETAIKHLGTLRLFAQGVRDIVVQRAFDAPRAHVFDAFTTPDMVKRWLRPNGWPLVDCEIAPAPGGAYRYRVGAPHGAGVGWCGVHREVLRPERLVRTERFEPAWYPGEAVIATVFDECAGSTRVTITMTYECAAARDTVLASPLRNSETANYDRLARLLA